MPKVTYDPDRPLPEKVPKPKPPAKKNKGGRPRKPTPATKPEQYANLFDFSKLSGEERHELAKKAAAKSAEVRSRKKSFKDALEMFLDLPLTDASPIGEKLRPIFPNLTNRDAMSLILIAKGLLEGDIKAFETIRDTIGEAPARQLSIQNNEPMVITVQTISHDSPSPATIIDVTPDSPQLTSPSVAPVQQEYSNNA